MNIRVLQWNVWFRERADRVIELIKQADADILCLQELTQNSAVNPGRNIPLEINKLGYNHEFVLALEHTGQNYRYMGNGIFSKFPITRKSHTFVQRAGSEVPSFDQENRLYVEITTETPAGPLTIGTVHLSFTDNYTDSPAKAAETTALLGAISPHRRRFILAGDFNARPPSQVIQAVAKQLAHAGPDYSQPSWSTKPNAYHFKIGYLADRIDYVFTTPDIQVISSRFIETDISDHLPILTEVTLTS